MSASDEILGTVALGDLRLHARLRRMVEAMAEHPEASLPQTFGSWAATLAAYRFFANHQVTLEALEAALVSATRQRCVGHPTLLAIQDTTALDYTTHPATTGLGRLHQRKRQGLLVHTTLAVTEDGLPLGVLAIQVWARSPDPVADRHRRPIEGKESRRWLDQQQAARAALAPTPTITVADREADIFEVFTQATALGGHWVIRARHDRTLANEETSLVAQVEAQPGRWQEDLPIHAPAGTPDRVASVVVRTAQVVVAPPRPLACGRWWAAHPEILPLVPPPLSPLALGVVLVEEVAPPPETTPVRWLLVTNLPVETDDDVARVIRCYRWRWLIERYHFVLKRGCRVEQLQLEEGTGLARAVVLYGGVAWWVLWVTLLARAAPEAPCTVAVEAVTWQALAVRLGKPLATAPTLREFVRQVAQLGGFLGRRGDGEPGVQTLWRGMQRLQEVVATWVAAQQALVPPSR